MGNCELMIAKPRLLIIVVFLLVKVLISEERNKLLTTANVRLHEQPIPYELTLPKVTRISPKFRSSVVLSYKLQRPAQD